MNPIIIETVGDVVVRRGDMTEVRAAFYAKSSCRRCHGRGVLHFSHPNGTERAQACSCVFRRIERAQACSYVFRRSR